MFFRANRNASRAIIVALVACVSCDHLVDPPLPPDAVRFVPPVVYACWWAMVESCSGIDRPLGDIEWYAAPDYLRSPDDNSEFIQGYWSLASNRIVLVSNDTLDGGTVRHEMLHALLRVGKQPRP